MTEFFNSTCLKWQFLEQERIMKPLKTHWEMASKISAKERATERATKWGGKVKLPALSISTTWLDPLYAVQEYLNKSLTMIMKEKKTINDTTIVL